MKPPRFRIAWVMGVIAIIAVEFAVIRIALDNYSPIVELLVLGALPMTNVLAIGVLVGHLRHADRAFLLGFELFGAVSLAVYDIGLAGFFPEQVVIPYIVA